MKSFSIVLSLLALCVFGNANEIKVINGWGLYGTSGALNIEKFNKNSIDMVWCYDKDTQSWYVYSPKESLKEQIKNAKLKQLTQILPNSGFWIKGNSNDMIVVDDNLSDYNTTIHPYQNDINISTYPESNLTDDQKYALAYMWNEEKLAKDIYLALYKVQPVMQLEKIGANAETRHEQMVEDLVAKYDINITNLTDYTVKYSEEELRAMPSGTYGIDKIQNLYNALYEKGSKSQIDAAEVGCMVEVTDITDLDEYISVAEETDATDLIDVFSNLREGSYSHYWAFDSALKNLGVSEGCCSLGVIDGVDYCHPEYPQNSRGGGRH